MMLNSVEYEPDIVTVCSIIFEETARNHARLLIGLFHNITSSS